MATRVWRAVLVVATVVEVATNVWCTFVPLWPWQSNLQTLPDWASSYSPYTAVIDICLASCMKAIIIGICVLAAPIHPERPRRHVDAAPTIHPQLIAIASLAAATTEALVMGKAVLVAIGAPDQVFPPPAPSSTPAPDADIPFVGLLYMFGMLVVTLLGSMVQAWSASEIVTAAQVAYAADTGPTSSLTTPLLAEHKADAADAAETGAAKPRGSQAAGKTGSTAKDGVQDPANKGVSSKTVSHLLSLFFPDWPMISLAFTAGSLAALAQVAIPYYTGQTIDYASIEPDRAKFMATIKKLVIVAALCGLLTGIRGSLFTVAMSKLNVRLRKQLFKSLLAAEVGFFDTTKTGEITSRLAADTSTVSDSVCLNMNVMLRSLTAACMVLVFMMAASWRLTVVTFILIPAIMVLSSVYGRIYSALAKQVQAELADANGVAEEVLSSMTTVKAHASQGSAEHDYAVRLDKFFAVLVREALVYLVYQCLNTFLPNAVAALVLLYGGRLVLAGKMSPGSLVSFMLYQSSLSSSFQALGDVFSALTGAVGAADKVLELMHRKPLIPPGGQLIPASFKGHIELRDVCFAYPARPHAQVLHGLSFKVEAGEVVALVGASGGGKSSVVKLVERFYLPQSGEVLLDGIGVSSYHDKWLRRNVALVSQEPTLYARSIRRNILFGLEAENGVDTAGVPSQQDIEEAAKQANAHDFIMAMSDGYDTNCGEKGVQMSGGQKQRIAIARALVRKPRVLLLDEATSALDADSEAVVQEALDRVMRGRTVLVIAHRLSTIQGADRIILIGKGRVQEVGTHAELLAHNGMYASLVRKQLQRTESSASLTQLLHRDPSSAAVMQLGNHAYAASVSAAQVSSSSLSMPPAGVMRSPGAEQNSAIPVGRFGGSAVDGSTQNAQASCSKQQGLG